MNNAVNKLAAFTALAASFAGLMVSNSADASQLKIFGLSPDKTGTMKDGTKDVPYLVLAKTDDSTVTVMLHPNDANKLFKKGEAGTYKVIPADTAATEESTVPAEAQLQLQAELAAEQGQAAPDAKPAKLSKEEKAAAKLAAKEAKAAEKAAAKATKATAEPKEVKVTGTSKAQAIFNEELANVKGDINSKELRGKVVPRFKAELGMGAPGASTYYQNCKAKAKTAPATEVAPTEGAKADEAASA